MGKKQRMSPKEEEGIPWFHFLLRPLPQTLQCSLASLLPPVEEAEAE